MRRFIRRALTPAAAAGEEGVAGPARRGCVVVPTHADLTKASPFVRVQCVDELYNRGLSVCDIRDCACPPLNRRATLKNIC